MPGRSKAGFFGIFEQRLRAGASEVGGSGADIVVLHSGVLGICNLSNRLPMARPAEAACRLFHHFVSRTLLEAFSGTFRVTIPPG
jgi:hypothetical protein